MATRGAAFARHAPYFERFTEMDEPQNARAELDRLKAELDRMERERAETRQQLESLKARDADLTHELKEFARTQFLDQGYRLVFTDDTTTAIHIESGTLHAAIAEDYLIAVKELTEKLDLDIDWG